MNNEQPVDQEYLTQFQAAKKLSYTGNVNVAIDGDFATKSQCLDMGATTDPLEKYPHWDFPAADDIVPGLEFFQITVSVSGNEGGGTPAVSKLNVYYSK